MSIFKDKLNIIFHLSIHRIWNLCLLKISYFLTKIFKKTFLIGKPFSLSIEPTTACNLGCPECPSGLKKFSRTTGKLNTTLNQNILNQVSKHVFYINYYFQGEPFLNPAFLSFIKQAKAKKIYTSTSTNAHFIDDKKAKEIIDSGLDRLIISLDGMTQKTYENYRVNGQIDKVFSAIQVLQRAKKESHTSKPHLILQFLVVRQNEHEISELESFAKECGIDDVRLKTAQFYEYKNGNSLMPTDESYSRYKKLKDGTYQLKYKLGNHCWRMWSGSVVTWDGKIVPCCFDKDAQHTLGDLQVNSFLSIWKSNPYQSFRLKVFKNRNQIEICQNCSEGAQIWS